jgi:ketosteroid isomerase-like protein
MYQRVALIGLAAVWLALSVGGGEALSARSGSPNEPAAMTQAAQRQEDKERLRRVEDRMKNIEKYFAAMEEDVSVYDPASPFLFDGKAAWRQRVPHLHWDLLDLLSFHREVVELGDMRITTFYRSLRRIEGSMTSRLHGKITFVHLKQPDGSWWLWHDHTSENAEDYSYNR